MVTERTSLVTLSDNADVLEQLYASTPSTKESRVTGRDTETGTLAALLLELALAHTLSDTMMVTPKLECLSETSDQHLDVSSETA